MFLVRKAGIRCNFLSTRGCSHYTTPVHTWLTQKMSGSITNTFYSCYHSNEIIFLISWRQNTRRRTRIELQRRGTTSSTWQGSKSPTIRDVTDVILKERRPSNGRNSVTKKIFKQNMVLNYHKEIFSTYIFKTAFCYTGTVQKINNNTGVVSNYAGQGIQILSFSKVNYEK